MTGCDNSGTGRQRIAIQKQNAMLGRPASSCTRGVYIHTNILVEARVGQLASSVIALAHGSGPRCDGVLAFGGWVRATDARQRESGSHRYL